jgi:CheY-like chemotaxis protein
MMNDLRTLLLVEDSPRDVELTLEALNEHRLANEVVVVHDGAEALDYLQMRGAYASRGSGNPAVILLDLKMPKMDGLTSSNEERDVVESYQLGVNAYVVKPVGFIEFIDAIENLGLFWAVLNQPPPQNIRRAA